MKTFTIWWLGLSLALVICGSTARAAEGPPATPAKPVANNRSTPKNPMTQKAVSTESPSPASPSAPAPKTQQEAAVLAGGCFWGMEEIIRKIPGVIDTSVGYIGGTVPFPTYEQVCSGRTGHAEAVKIVYDPAKLSFEQVLGYFFRMHDPTTLNRQHNDIGTQYRSAIFVQNEAQKQVAEKVKAQVAQSGKFKKPVVTEITAAGEYYPAETYHQDYLQKNPHGYNCHVLRD